MRNVRLVCTILLISSGCILANPSHRRAAVAGHWGSDTISTNEPNEEPANADNVVINDQTELANPVNNFPEAETSDENVEQPPIQSIGEEENSVGNSDDGVTVAALTTSSEEEVDTPFPNVGKIEDIIEAGNSGLLQKVDLKNVGKENVLIAREKDGDYHIHIRVPADKAIESDVVEPEIGDTTDAIETETETATEIDVGDDDVDATESTVSDTTEESAEVLEKGKSAPEAETLKPETEQAEATSWFRHNDGTLNYLAILAVMFFLFI